MKQYWSEGEYDKTLVCTIRKRVTADDERTVRRSSTNNVIGELVEVEVGVPGELSGSALGPQETMPVPKELNYDMWLGPAFSAPYTMQRVHEPGTIDSRPGLRCRSGSSLWGLPRLTILTSMPTLVIRVLTNKS